MVLRSSSNHQALRLLKDCGSTSAIFSRAARCVACVPRLYAARFRLSLASFDPADSSRQRLNEALGRRFDPLRPALFCPSDVPREVDLRVASHGSRNRNTGCAHRSMCPADGVKLSEIRRCTAPGLQVSKLKVRAFVQEDVEGSTRERPRHGHQTVGPAPAA